MGVGGIPRTCCGTETFARGAGAALFEIIMLTVAYGIAYFVDAWHM